MNQANTYIDQRVRPCGGLDSHERSVNTVAHIYISPRMTAENPILQLFPFLRALSGGTVNVSVTHKNISRRSRDLCEECGEREDETVHCNGPGKRDVHIAEG